MAPTTIGKGLPWTASKGMTPTMPLRMLGQAHLLPLEVQILAVGPVQDVGAVSHGGVQGGLGLADVVLRLGDLGRLSAPAQVLQLELRRLRGFLGGDDSGPGRVY